LERVVDDLLKYNSIVFGLHVRVPMNRSADFA
jgi:hypothetical protein